MESNITKEVIFSYLAGSCTALQKSLIDDWVKDEVNRELFFSWLYEWEKKNAQYQVDVEAGLDRHRAWVMSLGESEAVADFKPPVVGRLFPPRIVAAACGLLMTLLAGWLSQDVIRYKTYETDFGEIRKITLSDGSKVVVNANSTLRVPRFGFGNSKREVLLTGEASFDVVHTQNHTRFVVKTNKNMNVEVLGTEFDVYARSSGARVVLNTGKIQLHYSDGHNDQKLTLKPGDLVSMDRKGKMTMSHTAQPQNYSAWKYHRFVFEDESFRQICNRLEETFGTEIIIRDRALADKEISGSFTALDAEELLDLLSLAGDFSYISKDSRIIVSGDTPSVNDLETQKE
ncbi:FecR domain-containing protein [Dyadobacter sp. 676]|uniref:FecR domain-containing protein n=1 Tax=Dyadobacter sp. 676 TaxID=3088362 RepID=A0AAU8FLA5_9BACT